jgi:hypothetical protein
VNPNAVNFSPEDIMIGRGIDSGRPPLVLYLGTPKRQIKKLHRQRYCKAQMPRTTACWGNQSSCARA